MSNQGKIKNSAIATVLDCTEMYNIFYKNLILNNKK